uniref:Uncharacterized protein n=1 Tax=Rhizophora mucronata TaxID=61149 RepID=A0A2P2L4E5_RHIMU
MPHSQQLTRLLKKYSYLSGDDFTLCSTVDIERKALRRDESRPFLGGSTITTSDPMSQKSGSC